MPALRIWKPLKTVMKFERPLPTLLRCSKPFKTQGCRWPAGKLRRFRRRNPSFPKKTSPEAVLARQTETLDALRNRLDLQARQRTADAGNRLTALRLQLDALSPTAVLKRGYAIVTDSEERPIARQRQLTADQSVRLIFQDGVREARITD